MSPTRMHDGWQIQGTPWTAYCLQWTLIWWFIHLIRDIQIDEHIDLTLHSGYENPWQCESCTVQYSFLPLNHPPWVLSESLCASSTGAGTILWCGKIMLDDFLVLINYVVWLPKTESCRKYQLCYLFHLSTSSVINAYKYLGYLCSCCNSLKNSQFKVLHDLFQ